MMFCPKCGSIMIPKKTGKSIVNTCPKCGFSEKSHERVEFKEVMTDKDRVEAVEEEHEVYPLSTAVECPKCGHNGAYFWEVQTRASDEPATKFYKCEKCRHIWRDYK